MAEAGTRRARRWLGWGALPASIAALAVLLVRGAFLEPLELRAPHLAAWALLVGAGMVAVARQLRRKLRGVRSPWWWAAEACASGKLRKITGLTFPAAISGQTFCSIARAIAAFSGTERARSVEPVWVRRLSISRRKSTLARGEP